jgi:RHS repeat-associated protein
LKLNFDYGGIDNNGNVKSQQITVQQGNQTPLVLNQSYVYDSLNRLKSAEEKDVNNVMVWKQTFVYDRFGNRTFDTSNNNTTTLGNGCPVAICNPSANPQDNKLVGTNYDSVGNTKIDANGQTFIYDAENKQVQVNNANGIVGQYYYDGDGKRIKKFVPSTSETTIFVYDAGGKMVAEYSTVTASQSEAKISYLTNDHLGSPRITTDATGKVISRRDFMPFGEEIARANYGSDSVRQKFTGYQKDAETGLDFAQARMFGSSLGRFTSPDPTLLSVNAHNPQSWNRYVYVLNNPLLYTDPLGLWELTYEDRTKDKKNKDGTITKVFDRRVVIAKKSKEGDDGASLAKQLGLTGKDATKFAEKIGGGDGIQLSKQGGDVGRIFGAVESGLTEQKKFEDKNPSKVGEGPRSSDCSETACRIAYPQQLFGTLVFSVQEADQTITGNNAKSVSEGELRIGDIVRWAKNGDPTHFASFIFRNDNGVPEVFSKSGALGPYERAPINGAGSITQKYGSIYGTVQGINKTDTGFYRP